MPHAFQPARHNSTGLTLAEQLRQLRAEMPGGIPPEVPPDPVPPGEVPPEEVPPIKEPPIPPEMPPTPTRMSHQVHAG